jgi:hypothetical protein
MGTQGRDLVLRQVPNQEGLHLFSPSSEGPFKVTECADPWMTILLRLKEYLFQIPRASL